MKKRMRNEKKRHICIVVMGDFGRSPRMNYHALSLAKHGFNVDVVAYAGTQPQEGILHSNNITLHLMNDPPNFSQFLPRLLVYVAKVLWQFCVLFRFLLGVERPTHILVQNPPSIPTFPVALLVCWWRKSNLVVDWHNYGYTILGLTLGSRHLLVKIAQWAEGFFGSYAHDHLCVTRAMKEDLQANWGINASVLYDRPSERFHPIEIDEQHELFLRLSSTLPQLKASVSEDSEKTTRFTKELLDGGVDLREDRPALVVSSTSWTEDEDFSILLDGLEDYDRACSEGVKKLPKLICIVTGKGRQRSYYEKEILKKKLNHVTILTVWLSAGDYPKLLASANLGISLHSSSSGLDLPMKVVDMFGSGLPVCALTFSCLYELVKHGENGYIFANSKQLSQQLQALLSNFPSRTDQLDRFRNNVQVFRSFGWDQSWDENASQIFYRN